MYKMQPGVRVGGEVKGAEGVALAGHVLPQQVPGAVHLQVGLQVRLLLEKKNIGLRRGLDLGQHLHGGDLKELLVLLLVHVEAGLHVLDQLHLVHLQVNVGLDEKSK